MKILISEEQFDRFKKGMKCKHIVRFEYVERGTLYRGRRFVCVSEEFYNRLNDECKDGPEGLSDEMLAKIRKYFGDTYYMTEAKVDVNFIHTGDVPVVSVKYTPWDKKINEEDEPNKSCVSTSRFANRNFEIEKDGTIRIANKNNQLVHLKLIASLGFLSGLINVHCVTQKNNHYHIITKKNREATLTPNNIKDIINLVDGENKELTINILVNDNNVKVKIEKL